MARNLLRLLRLHPIRLLVACAFVLTASIAAGPLPSRNTDFTLQARVLVAMEDGPVVVEATSVYQGKKELLIYKFAGRDDFGVDWQPMWCQEFYVRSSSFIGCPHGQQTLVPDQRRTAAKFIHRNYSRIPPGKARLHIRWPVYEPGEFAKDVPRLQQFIEDPRQVIRKGFRKVGPMEFVIGKLIAEPETTVLVDVLPATAENLAALRNRWLKELEHPDIVPARADLIAECVVSTRHNELFDLILKVLDYPAASVDVHKPLQRFYEGHSDKREGIKTLLQYVKRPDALRPALPFVHRSWQEYIIALDQPKMLCGVRNPWVRLATYVTFPQQCPEKWKADLRAELSNLPELPAVVEEIRRLDDKNFAVREKATVRLRNLEWLAEPAIRAHLKGNPSAESRRRCEQILADWERQPTDFNISSAFTVLEGASGPEGKEILAILARGPADCRLPPRAKEALERLK